MEAGTRILEASKDAARVCRDGIRKAKAKLELNLAGDVKNHKMGFHSCVGQKIRLSNV